MPLHVGALLLHASLSVSVFVGGGVLRGGSTFHFLSHLCLLGGGGVKGRQRFLLPISSVFVGGGVLRGGSAFRFLSHLWQYPVLLFTKSVNSNFCAF